MKNLFCLMVFIVCIPQMDCHAQLEVVSIFSDNMVLQQKTKAPIWGKSIPNSEVNISTSWGEEIQINSDSNSSWFGEIETPEAGGPFTITITSNDEIINLENVLLGEVWLCSGQSNMEMPLKGWPPKDIILNSDEEIQNANNPNIRFFTVPQKSSLSELDSCDGSWEISTSNSTSNFSATAYFFGKRLYSELNVPIGLIHSSWGGTPVESWTSKKYLSSFNEFDSILANVEKVIPVEEKYYNWLDNFKSITLDIGKAVESWTELDFGDSTFSEKQFDDSNWPTMLLPTNWEKTSVGEFNGVVWFRRKIELPNNWLGKDLRIELGPIDDYDITYINGIEVGSQLVSGNWKTNRTYSIDAVQNNANTILIAIKVNDHRGGGGIFGKAELMNLVLQETNENISISGKWKYYQVAEYAKRKFFIFGDKHYLLKDRPQVENYFSGHIPSSLYNGMIRPLIPFSIKGVIWYQGESNTDNPMLYERLFPTLISNWRNDWGSNFPFYFVQIAPYENYGVNKNSAYLRDAQRKTLNVSKTGMAVTLDIGDIKNIHPANKIDVGERLALIALGNDYGKDIVYSGPLYNSMEISMNKIVLSFDHVGTGLLIRENEQNNQFLISGPDKKFIPAKVEISGDKLIVWSDEIDVPIAVRYAWTNISIASLFNKEGLPASSFRTDNW